MSMWGKHDGKNVFDEAVLIRDSIGRYRFRDKWGCGLLVDVYETKEGEKRIQIYMDNAEQTVRDWLEENEHGIDIPYKDFKLFIDMMRSV